MRSFSTVSRRDGYRPFGSTASPDCLHRQGLVHEALRHCICAVRWLSCRCRSTDERSPCAASRAWAPSLSRRSCVRLSAAGALEGPPMALLSRGCAALPSCDAARMMATTHHRFDPGAAMTDDTIATEIHSYHGWPIRVICRRCRLIEVEALRHVGLFKAAPRSLARNLARFGPRKFMSRTSSSTVNACAPRHRNALPRPGWTARSIRTRSPRAIGSCMRSTAAPGRWSWTFGRSTNASDGRPRADRRVGAA